LTELIRQETAERFTFSIVIADNDELQSARPICSEFSTPAIPVQYCVEPRQNIALARNKAVHNAVGEFIAFIDDDEFPTERWLLTLFEACDRYGVDGVLGPVKPHFDEKPPKWVVSGHFYERPDYRTGLVIDWREGRTNNMLLKRHVFEPEEMPFRPEFLTGEDQDFFRRAIAKGGRFVWCSEAVAYEVVPPIRWKRSFMLRRALLRGKISPLHPTFGLADVGKSLLAIPCYTLALPIALVFGQDKFMLCLIKLFDHLGKILAVLKINPMKDKYVTD
jgi:succinoglycan biosynthesis protein ExoM